MSRDELEDGAGVLAVTASVGIDIGGTKTSVVRMVGMRVAGDLSIETPGAAILSPERFAAIREVWSRRVSAVGVGVAGLVDDRDGRFVWGPHVAGTDVPVRERLASEFGVPAVVDNDANMGAWGELRAGAGRGRRHMLFVTLGTGIGGAVVADGEIYRGALGNAGEWGHMPFETGGLQCACGMHGCWETAASGPALARLARRYMDEHPAGSLAKRLGGGPVDPKAVTQAAGDDDREAIDLVASLGTAFGVGLGGLIGIFDPEIVVVGGGLGVVGEILLGPARRAAAERVVGGALRSLPTIVSAQLGVHANAIGAAIRAADMLAG